MAESRNYRKCVWNLIFGNKINTVDNNISTEINGLPTVVEERLKTFFWFWVKAHFYKPLQSLYNCLGDHIGISRVWSLEICPDCIEHKVQQIVSQVKVCIWRDAGEMIADQSVLQGIVRFQQS